MLPENDAAFEESTVVKVEPQKGGGWGITKSDGWSFYVPPTMDNAGLIEPQEGMTCRMYGRGIGAPVRGLFLNGRKVFYRTEAEDKEHNEIGMYGADAAEWLARWDAGKTVWTIEMGGLGPGYEQCIHITCAEILRWFIENNADAALWDEMETAKPIFDRMEKSVTPIIDKLGLSGAQWGAARNIACQLYRRGPRVVMSDDAVKDRHIQVAREFPHL